MEQRNAPCTNQMIDSDVDQQGQGFQHPELTMVVEGATNFPVPNIEGMVTVPRNAPNLGAHRQEQYDGSVFYGRPQFHDVSHHPHYHSTNYDLVFCPPPNFNIPYVAPCSTVPLNVGTGDRLLPCSNYGVIGFPADEYGLRNSYKRSSGAGALELGSHRSVRNRSGVCELEPVSVNSQSHFAQGNYMGHSFQPVGFPWQHLSNGSGDAGALPAWTHTPAPAYMLGNIGPQWYPEPPGNQNQIAFPQPPPVPHPFGFPHVPGPMQGLRDHSVAVPPQVPAPHFRFPSSHSFTPSQDGFDGGHLHPGSVQPTGLRIYRHQRGLVGHEATPRHHNLPQLRVLPTDGVALLEFPEYYDEETYTDDHRDMRLDVEHMSYEELLALGEQIGNVNTGVSDEIIRTQLKTKPYLSSTRTNLEEAVACVDQKSDSCIICQDDYCNQEVVATLDCGHEYHAYCLKKWLRMKNICPICKSEALRTGGKD